MGFIWTMWSNNYFLLIYKGHLGKKKNWFGPTMDIRMDNDIFADVVSKPMDITLSSNETFSIFDSNSIFSGRGNEMKLSYINFFPQS